VDKMMWVTLVIIVVFGGATLALHDETFIKWKPTVLLLALRGGPRAAELASAREPHPRTCSASR